MMHDHDGAVSSSDADEQGEGDVPSANREALFMAHFEIGNADSEDDDEEHSSPSNGYSDTPPQNGEQPQKQGFQNDDEEEGVPSPYEVFRTPVDLDFAEGSIMAPCDLPEGHVLRVDMGRGRILVTQVPYGGVKEGETFYAPYRIYDKPDDTAREYKPSPESPQNRTVGAWRARLCGCCEFGPCHPSFLGAFICQCFLLSQVMTRMHLNWIGLKSPPSTARKTLDGVFLIFAIFYFFRGITIYFWATGEESEESSEDNYLKGNLYSITLVVDFLFLLYIIIVTTRGRRAIRDNYLIPGDMVTDCCIGTLCHPCALSQMARQSANYRDHKARWCSDTGVSEEHDGEYGLTGIIHPMTVDRDLI